MPPQFQEPVDSGQDGISTGPLHESFLVSGYLRVKKTVTNYENKV